MTSGGWSSICYAVTTFYFVVMLNTVGCNSVSKEGNGTKLMFVFGDSLFDAGNNQYVKHEGRALGTYWPYGMSLHKRSTGRISDGRLVPDFIARRAKLRLIPPYLQPGARFKYGVNFASGGSGVLESFNTEVINLPTQLSNFKKVVASLKQKYGEAGAKDVLQRSVYLFSFGGNDYWNFHRSHPNATESETEEFVQLVIRNLTNALKEMYEMGMRKVAFQNLGPLGCYPISMQNNPGANESTCVPYLMNDATQHNTALAHMLQQMASTLPGFKYVLFDYHNAIRDRLINPTKYGFKVGFVACCGGGGKYNAVGCGGGVSGADKYSLCSNPKDHVMFDGGHHTQRTNKQLAALFWSDGAPQLTGPNTLKQLFQYP